MKKKVKKHHIILLLFLAALSAVSVFWFRGDSKDQNIVLRFYEESKDYTALVAIMEDNLFWLSERKDFSPHRILSWRAPYDDEKRKGEAKIAVAEYDGEVAGFISFFKNSPVEGFIWLLGVDKKFRGHGLGESLMRFAIQDLKKQHSQYITIATRTVNKPALSLYKKLGFIEQSTNDRGIVTLVLKNP